MTKETFEFVVGGDQHQQFEDFRVSTTFAIDHKVDAFFLTGDLVDSEVANGKNPKGLDGIALIEDQKLVQRKNPDEFQRFKELVDQINSGKIKKQDVEQELKEIKQRLYGALKEEDYQEYANTILTSSRKIMDGYKPQLQKLKKAGIKVPTMVGNHDLVTYEEDLGDLVNTAYTTSGIDINGTYIIEIPNSAEYAGYRRATPLVSAVFEQLSTPYLQDGHALPEDHPRVKEHLARVNKDRPGKKDILFTHKLVGDPRLQGEEGTAAKLALKDVAVNIAGHKHAPWIGRLKGGVIGLCAGAPEYFIHAVYDPNTRRLTRADVYSTRSDYKLN